MRPIFSKKQKTKPLSLEGDPILHRQKELTNLRNKLNDLRHKSKSIDFSVLPAAPCGQAGATERDDREAELIMTWMKLEDRASRLLGRDIVLQAVPCEVYVPNRTQTHFHHPYL